ncbi:hypothetical protein MNBD_BACTEROID05-1096, partial [hydrothermal vent metagenome]
MKSIILRNKRNAESVLKKGVAMQNPFAYGKEVSGENFWNREKEIKELCRDIVNGQNVIIFSQRRFGKTSLIKEVFNVCQRKGILTIYVDLYPVLAEEEFVCTYAKAVAETMLGTLEKQLKKVVGFFQKIQPSFSVGEDGNMVCNVAINKQDFVPALEDVLASVERYAKSKNKKVAVCFDEFQQIGQFKTDRIEKIMRSIIQKQKNVAYIFMGSKKHLIFDMFNNSHRPFYRSGKSFPLEKIEGKKLCSFIKDKFINSKKDIQDELIEKIVDICEGHPYYIQYLCHITWEKVEDKKRVLRSDLLDSLDLLLRREASTYEATWDLLTVKQRQVLKSLSKADVKEKIFSAGFLQKHNLGSASSLQRTLSSLIEKDLIDREGES